MQHHVLALAAVFGVVLTPMPGSAQRADLRRLVIGRWELNVAKSTFRPGAPPKSWTRVYEVSDEAHDHCRVAVLAARQRSSLGFSRRNRSAPRTAASSGRSTLSATGRSCLRSRAR